MKKRISVLVAAVLAIGCVATACGGNAGGDVKIGIGVHTDFAYGSYSYGEGQYNKEEGNGQADITMAAVKLGADGKIVEVIVDAVQVKGKFDATGKITSDLTAETATKRDLGLDYGMKGTSATIGAIKDGGEWFEQADAFEDWCVGKTADEVAAAMNADGYSSNADLTAGCTMKINGLQAAVVDACKNATWEGASSKDTLGLGIVAGLGSHTADATAEKEGKAEAYVTFVATTKAADGKVTCAVIDCIQANSTFDNTGKLTTDMTSNPESKYYLGNDYGMKGTSATIGVIKDGGEWFEQAEHLQKYVIGKTSSEVSAIALKDGYPTDADVTAGCTMAIGDIIKALTEALK